MLFFYPKDDSPGCTLQSCAFRDAHEDFVTAGAAVIGVSEDTVQSHRQFAAKRQLPFLLLSDSDGQIKKAFGVRKTFGLFPARVTYVIDRQGIVRLIVNSQLNLLRHVREALQIVREKTSTNELDDFTEASLNRKSF